MENKREGSSEQKQHRPASLNALPSVVAGRSLPVEISKK
jgi:hypothetical protein